MTVTQPDRIERLLDHLEDLLSRPADLGVPEKPHVSNAPVLGGERRALTGAEPVLSASKLLPLALESLRDEDDDAKDAAARTLIRLGDVAVPDLLALLHDDDRRVRYAAAWALGRIRDPHITTGLLRAMSWTYDCVRPPRDPQAVPLLLEAFVVGSRPTRVAVAVALGRLAPERPEIRLAIPDLIEALSDEYDLARLAAAWALARIADPDTVPHLIETLYDVDRLVGAMAYRALIAIGTPQALDALETLNHQQS